jgi:CubicO group peptidase (beta-lactamase class C family)
MRRTFADSKIKPLTAFVLAALLALAAATSLAELRGVSAAEGDRDLAVAAPETVGVSTQRLRRIEEAMKRTVDEKRIAGIVTLLTRKGKIVHHGAVGMKDVRKNDAVQKDSIFRIYSMTKPITGAAMMILYEEGKWRLEDPVSRHIPEFAKLQVFTGANPDGTLATEPARRSMTMRELMTHTAGLGYVLNSSNPVDRMIIQGQVLDTAAPLQTMIDKLAKVPLQSQPGTRWSYSIAVDVQGYLVEKLSGMKFDEFLRTRLFEPLGMRDTAFYVPKEKLSRLALVHTEAKQGGLMVDENRPDPLAVPLGPSGGGGLFSTANDYARVTEMLLNGGQFNGVRILAPRTVEMMRTNYVNPEPLKTMGPGLGWSLGFQVVTDAAAAGEPYSDGSYNWYGIAGTWFWIDPVKDFAFIGMLQHQNLGAARQVHALSRNLVYQAIMD